jgi:alkylation response protein AidB-like acyl-CoA dehydrogenase
MRHQELFPVPAAWFDDSDGVLADTVSRWAADRVMARRHELGESFEGLLTPALEALLDEVGLRHLIWPAPGAPEATASCATLAAALEEVGRADLGIAHVLAGHYALQLALCPGRSASGAAALRDRLRARGATGWSELGALVLPDYGAASSAFRGLRAPAVAERRGGAVALESGGPVRPRCAGADAGWFGVACELEGGAALVVVPGDAPGLRRGLEVLRKTGLRASRDVLLTLDRVEVPADHLVLVGDEPLRAVESWYRLGCAAGCAGALLAAHAILREWGETRVIKGPGHVFRDNALVAAQLGRIGARIGTSRLLVHSLAQLLDAPGDHDAAGSSAVSSAAVAVSTTVLGAAMEALDETMELMASAGYATEWQLERLWRDVKTLQTALGPAPSTLERLASHCFGSEVR